MRQKIRFWWVSRMEMNAMLPSLHSPVSGSHGGGETRDQRRSIGTKSRNIPGGKTRSCAKIANKVRALMARVGSFINCFHIIHLYSRKITLLRATMIRVSQKLSWVKWIFASEIFNTLRRRRERILNPGADAWGERYGGDLKVASNYGARRNLLDLPIFLKKNSPHLPFCDQL